MIRSSKLRVNIVSESEISVQGHGVHTAYEEMCRALEVHTDTQVIRGQFGKKVDCDIVHLHTVGPRVWRKLFQKGPKKVVSAHVVPDSFVGSIVGGQLFKPLSRLYLRWFYNKADLIIAVSDKTKSDLERIGVHKPIQTHYNFIDTSHYYQSDKHQKPSVNREELQIPKKAFVVMGAGQVQPRKRVDLFCTLAKKMPDITFVWVGGIPFGKIASKSSDMEKMMNSHIPNLHFPGIVEQSKMQEYYHMSDVFLLPSEQETFGLVVVEAAAAGLPIILRDISEYNDTFADSAILCSDDASFAKAIRSLQDKRIYAEWQKKSKVISDRFDSKQAAQDLKSLYLRLVNK